VEPGGLTAAEATYILNVRDADSLRARSAAAAGERTTRLHAKGIVEPQAEGQAEDLDYSAPPVEGMQPDEVTAPIANRDLPARAFCGIRFGAAWYNVAANDMVEGWRDGRHG